jgi:hypothetical protein
MEFVEFPRGKYTDQVDATTQFLDRAGELVRLKARPPGGIASAGFNTGLGQDYAIVRVRLFSFRRRSIPCS